MAQGLQIWRLCLDGIDNDIEGNQASIIGGFWAARKEREAGLWARRIGAKLIQEVEGLGFEILVGGSTPSNFDCFLDLRMTVPLVTFITSSSMCG